MTMLQIMNTLLSPEVLVPFAIMVITPSAWYQKLSFFLKVCVIVQLGLTIRLALYCVSRAGIPLSSETPSIFTSIKIILLLSILIGLVRGIITVYKTHKSNKN